MRFVSPLDILTLDVIFPAVGKRALFIEHDHVTLSGPLWRAFENRGYEVVRMPIVEEHNFESPNVSIKWPDFSYYDIIVPMGAPWGVWEDERIGN